MAAAPRCPSLVLVLLLLLSCCCGALSAAADEKLIHLHFYFHEINAGTPNATVVNIASLHKNRNGTAFGDVYVFDDALREGPDPASRLIGRAQGMVVYASLDGSSVFAAINFIFSGDQGEYSGSTLATQGHFAASGAPSERSIVGGTGRLRFARGYMHSRLFSSTDTSITVVFDMHFTLPHS